MKYSLRPNEVVLLRDTAYHGKNNSGELILTNLSLVMNLGSSFGKSKGHLAFPLNQIKVHNGRAQALMRKDGSWPVLEVYFLHGEEVFRFGAEGKKIVPKWVAKINEAVTGQPTPEETSSSIPGADAVVDLLKDAVGAFRSIRGSKNKSPEVSPTPMATNCTSCRAPVSGLQGQTVTCDYCNAPQQL